MRFTANDFPALRSELDDEFDALTAPSAPQTKFAVANAAALPPAASWIECEAWVRDIQRLAVSNGVNWIRTDTGASL